MGDGPGVSELSIAEQALEVARALDQAADVEVAVDRHRLALTRFANSVIHQNVAEDTLSVRVRVHRDGRTASGSSTIADPDGLRTLVNRTIDAAGAAPRDPGWPGPAPPAPIGDVGGVDAETAGATPQDRAERVRAFVDAADGLEAAGYCRTHHWTGTFVDSAGQTVCGASAEVGMVGIARQGGVDGLARATSARLVDIDGAVLASRAAAKSNAAVNPVELPPGRYEVVLEPTAVADVLEALSMFGFNAKAVAERRSFVRLGDAQFDASITLVDDAPAVGVAYDADGTPCRRVTLVDRGTTVSLTHDRRTAAAAGTASTGHGVGSPTGAFARHLAVRPRDETAGPAGEVDGPIVDDSAAELVADVRRGLLVTDFWYTRVLDPRSLVLTGLTRNGVWLVEDGAIVAAVRNLRFTQSYAQALLPGAILGVGRTAVALPGDTYVARSPRWTAPALRLASWNFTGGASG